MPPPQDTDLDLTSQQRSASALRTAVVAVVISSISIAAVIALFFKIGWLRFNPSESISVNGFLGYILLSAVFGAAVGASEIVSRYRDEPFLTLRTTAGYWYMALNALISAGAFYILVHYQGQIFSSLKQDLLMTSIVAGFGAMVVMRSKLFNFKTEGGENYSIGPEAVLNIFLTSVDRQIDRYRASRRQELVFKESKGVMDPNSAPGFLRAFLVSYQNLSNDEKAKINANITDTYNSPGLATPRLKFMAVAFGLLNIMGEKNFRGLVSLLKQYQELEAVQAQGSPAPRPVTPPLASPPAGPPPTSPPAG